MFLITKNLGWAKFIKGSLKPTREHNWFLDSELTRDLSNSGFSVIKKEFIKKSSANGN